MLNLSVIHSLRYCAHTGIWSVAELSGCARWTLSCDVVLRQKLFHLGAGLEDLMFPLEVNLEFRWEEEPVSDVVFLKDILGVVELGPLSLDRRGMVWIDPDVGVFKGEWVPSRPVLHQP